VELSIGFMTKKKTNKAFPFQIAKLFERKIFPDSLCRSQRIVAWIGIFCITQSFYFLSDISVSDVVLQSQTQQNYCS
jgi:hypothetical protein